MIKKLLYYNRRFLKHSARFIYPSAALFFVLLGSSNLTDVESLRILKLSPVVAYILLIYGVIIFASYIIDSFIASVSLVKGFKKILPKSSKLYERIRREEMSVKGK